MIKAIFFDLDDTLINFGGVSAKAWELTCESLAETMSLPMPPHQLAKQICIRNEAYWSDEDNRPKGNTDFQKSRRDILTLAFLDLQFENLEAMDYLLKHYAKNKEEAIYIFEDTHETLTKLKQAGYQLVLITNGDSQRQRGKIARFDLEKYFDHILIEGEQEFGKPDVRIYQKACDLCHIFPQEACMVGDNLLWEVIAPLQYGLKGIWMNFEQKPLPVDCEIEPTLIIHHLSELLDQIHLFS